MKLGFIYGDNMLFSADKPIRIAGSGKGKFKAELCGNVIETEVVDEKWVVELPKMSAGGPYNLNLELDGEKLTIKNILIGKLYIAAGQSNIEFKLKESDYPKEKLETEKNIRFITIDRFRNDINPKGWIECEKNSIDEISALSYHFSLDLYRKIGVPTGVICCHRGASIIETWMCKDDCENQKFILSEGEKHLDHTLPDFSEWNKSGYLYENAFSLIPPLAVDGVVWYQGESDTTVAEAEIYPLELEVMVNRWRKDLKDTKLPFYIIQIADYDARSDEGWKTMQQAQVRACEHIDNSYLIESRDVCSSTNIHPPEKEKLGLRIAQTIFNHNFK